MLERVAHIATLGLLLSAGSAGAGPYLVREADIFDQLATTFPIEDWMRHARNRSDAFVEAAHSADPRHPAPCINTAHPAEREPRAVAVPTLRARPYSAGVGPTLLSGPCARIAATGARRPALPDLPGHSPMKLVLPEDLDQMVWGPRR